MRRFVWMLALLALPIAGCESDAANNGHSFAYLIDDASQLPTARTQAQAECVRYNRTAGLYNVTQFQHVLVVFDCRPPDDVRFEIKTPPTVAPAS